MTGGGAEKSIAAARRVAKTRVAPGEDVACPRCIVGARAESRKKVVHAFRAQHATARDVVLRGRVHRACRKRPAECALNQKITSPNTR